MITRRQVDAKETSSKSQSYVDPIEVKVIDLNVAFEVTPENPRIRFGTGLKEWSAPETRNAQYQDYKIDSWTLGCIMFFLSVGDPPFEPESAINDNFNFYVQLEKYQDSANYPEMVDFLSKTIVVDPKNRMTSLEALRHPWLNAKPYSESVSLRRLQMKIMTE